MNAIALGTTLFAYLCGSVSGVILICRLPSLPDPSSRSYGNPQVTSVLRIGVNRAGSGMILFDIIKGMIPVWIGYSLYLPPFWLGLVSMAACLGHMYPLFFQCRGDQGVATALGAIAPIGYDLSALMIGTWLLTVVISGYSSLGAIVSAFIAPFYVWWCKPQFTVPIAMLSSLVLLRHHNNIQKLLRGQEMRIWRQRRKR